MSGALGFHRAAVVPYLGPEIIGFVPGSLAAALAFKDFRTGSAPFVRFVLVKGALDHVIYKQGELFRVEGPSHEAMEGTWTVGMIMGIPATECCR